MPWICPPKQRGGGGGGGGGERCVFTGFYRDIVRCFDRILAGIEVSQDVIFQYGRKTTN